MPTVYVRKNPKPKKAPPTGSTLHSSGKYKVSGNKVMIKSNGGWRPKYTTTDHAAALKLMQRHYGK